MRFLPVVVFLSSIVLCSCREEFKGERVPLVKVFDKYLYKAEVAAFVPAGTPRQDSVSMSQAYIRNWITKELLLAKAIENLSEEEKGDVRKQVDEYATSLFIHKYKSKLIAQRMDRNVRDDEIEAYYTGHQVNFILDHPVVKAVLVIVPKSAANIEGFRTWFRSDDPGNIDAMEEYCITNAKKYDDFDDRWVELRYLMSFLPIDLSAWEKKHGNDVIVETEDDECFYFLKIKERVREREVAPESYVKQEIELILLNRRKIEFEEGLERQINEEGARRHFISIYE
jgi:hypothetical protein